MNFKIVFANIMHIFMVLACSCQNRDIDIKKESIDINSMNFKKIIDIKELFESYQIIPLETNDSSLVGEAFDIKMTKDNIILGDRRFTNSIFIFNKNGEFVNEIKHVGKGPGEYINLQTFDVDEEQNQVLIYDYTLKKLSRYDFAGKWLSDKGLDFRAFNFAFNNGFYYFDRRNAIIKKDIPEKYNLLVFDKDLEMIKKFGKYKAYVHNYMCLSGRYPIQKIGDGCISYLSSLDNNILEIKDNKIIREYIFKHHKFPKVDAFEEYSNNHTHPMKVYDEMEEEGYVIDLTHINSVEWMYLYWKDSYVKKNVWYNKMNNKGIYYGKIENSFCDLPIGRIFHIENEYAYSIIEDLSGVRKEILDALKLNINSNPVIIKYKIRDSGL